MSGTDMDSHADSPVVRKNAYILSTRDRHVKVNGFTKALGSKTVHVVDATVAYECEYKSKVYILIIRNALYFKEMDVNLIAPFILRLTGLKINEEPKFIVNGRTKNAPRLDLVCLYSWTITGLG